MSGLQIDSLTVRFDATIAVDEVTLHVVEGSVFALVGPSGCGKSSLLRAVAGLVEPTSGSIRWDNTDLSGAPTHKRDIGLMFQDHALFTHRSVAENIGFGLKMQGVDIRARRRRVDELLEMVGLAGLGHRSVERLSGGEAQRVALARALAPEPRLLLLDEPLASLDRARRLELNAELTRLLGELGQTALYVTHDQEEAFAVADEIGVMNEGSLLRTGTPSEVWRDPQSEFVARFVGHDTIIDRDGRRYAVRADAVALAVTDEPSTVAGVVTSCVFRGDRHQVAVDAQGLSWTVFSLDAVSVGQPVGLIIDDSRLAPLS